MSKAKKYVEQFIMHLQKLDRKGYAELRRSLGSKPGYYMPAIPYVEPFAVSLKYDTHKKAVYLFAGLFCLANRPLEGSEAAKQTAGNLGSSIGNLYLAKDKSGSIEKRFIRLLDADSEQLPGRLRQMVTLLTSNNIGINWERLLEDLLNWYQPSKSVQHNWARQFYMQEKNVNSLEESNTSGGNK